nr:MAG TPA: hypothetical protein [Caudoviricetes sp.]
MANANDECYRLCSFALIVACVSHDENLKETLIAVKTYWI